MGNASAAATRIIDFHAHAFPDALAERAIPALEAEGHCKARLDGKVASLLKSMDAAGIARAALCSIATKPEQFDAILRWSGSVASERLIPFPSLHPRAADAVAQVRAIHEKGFKGIKLHPYYQDFELDEKRMFPIYEAVQACGLILLCHTGFDIAFPRIRRCDPVRIVKVIEAFPTLKLVTSHYAAWEDWDEVRARLLGRPLYMDISYSLPYLGEEEARRMILAHPKEYVLFGTDSPWGDQAEDVAAVRRLNLGAEREERVFFRNAETLLGIGAEE